jgi:ferredoxin
VARQPDLAVSGHAYGGCAETAHRNSGFVERGHSREQLSAQRCGRRRRERSARKDGAKGNAFVGLDGHPQPVRVGAPREHRRERGMAVLEEPLNSWNGTRSFSSGNRDFVDHDGFSVLKDGLPALADTRVYELDQPRFGLTLGHMGAMVTLPDMAYVIVQPCVGVKDASCVEVCPVDCIHTDDAATMYFIDPDECIDCGACVDPCPVDAIFPEDEVPEQWREYIKINADYFKK